MITNYLTATGLIMLLLLGWVAVQQAARLFARRYPQFGPAREEGGGCGSSCLCSGRATCKGRR